MFHENLGTTLLLRLGQYCLLANLQLTVSSSVFHRIFIHFSYQFCSHSLFSILFSLIVLNSVLTCIEEGLHSERSQNIPIDMRNEKDSEECALPSRKRKKTNEKETGQNIFEIKLFGTIKINFFLSERFHKEL